MTGNGNNQYRNNTNKSFKQLTKEEKKEVEYQGKLRKLLFMANRVKDLRLITNEILSNTAYHEKNIEVQFQQFDKLKVPKEEKELIIDAWELKNKKAKKLMNDLRELIDYENNNK